MRRYIVLWNDWPTELVDGTLCRSSKGPVIGMRLSKWSGATVFTDASAARRAIGHTLRELGDIGSVDDFAFVPLSNARVRDDP